MVPVAFVLCTIMTLYLIYVCCHCLPMLQLSELPDQVDSDMRFRGSVETCVFHFITAMLVLSYVRCVLVHPGEVPQQEDWLITENAGKSNLAVKELKKDGKRRNCKWCGKYKPDRCHHCRVCRQCILKMDHHCPWIYNCVGFQNYKFFFLLLTYTMLDTHFIIWTMSESMVRSVDENAPFVIMFFILFGLSLSFLLGTLVTLFYGFHVWLMLQGMTTIEFCEQVLPKQGMVSCWICMESDSIYNLGAYGNIQAVLGDNPLLWLFPFSGPPGDGLNFEIAELPYYSERDMEVGRGNRRKGTSKKLAVPVFHYGATTSEPKVHYHRQYSQSRLR